MKRRSNVVSVAARTGAIVLALVGTFFAPAPALAQSEADGLEKWFQAHNEHWRANAQDCLKWLNQAQNVEAQMTELNQRRPKDAAVVAALNAKTAERTKLLNEFKGCANEKNRPTQASRTAPAGPSPELKPLTPKIDERNTWTDKAAGIFVDEKGTKWRFPPYIDHSGVRFKLNTSVPPTSAIGQVSFPLAQYTGPGGRQVTGYGERLPK